MHVRAQVPVRSGLCVCARMCARVCVCVFVRALMCVLRCKDWQRRPLPLVHWGTGASPTVAISGGTAIAGSWRVRRNSPGWQQGKPQPFLGVQHALASGLILLDPMVCLTSLVEQRVRTPVQARMWTVLCGCAHVCAHGQHAHGTGMHVCDCVWHVLTCTLVCVCICVRILGERVSVRMCMRAVCTAPLASSLLGHIPSFDVLSVCSSEHAQAQTSL